jgi:hypothetical protein
MHKALCHNGNQSDENNPSTQPLNRLLFTSVIQYLAVGYSMTIDSQQEMTYLPSVIIIVVKKNANALNFEL